MALSLPLKPSTPEQLAQVRAQLLHQMSEQAAAAADTRVHVAEPGSGPRFEVKHYQIIGNTVLPPATLAGAITNIDGDFGTNVSFGGIRAVVTELQKAYRLRGYVTVSVGLPQQKLTNATVNIQVTEGRLAAIEVKGNRYFSSNNVMSVLPSLHTNIILNAQVLQAELNRANGNHNRQIYPVIGPGPDPGTSELTLKVKDELPLHAKVEFNNENSPGTPDLRVNTSAVYENLYADQRVEYPIERTKGYFYRLVYRHTISICRPLSGSGGGRPTEYGGDVEMGLLPAATRRWITTGSLPEYRLTTSAMRVAYTLAALTVSVRVAELTTGRDGAEMKVFVSPERVYEELGEVRYRLKLGTVEAGL